MSNYVSIAYRFDNYSSELPHIVGGILNDYEAAVEKAREYVKLRGGKYGVGVYCINSDGNRLMYYEPSMKWLKLPYFPQTPYRENDINEDSIEYLLWLDDERDPRNHRVQLDCYFVYWVKTYEEFVEFLDKKPWSIISFDNDLGTAKEGKDAFNYLEELLITGKLNAESCIVQVHSANTSARLNMLAGIENLRLKGLIL